MFWPTQSFPRTRRAAVKPSADVTARCDSGPAITRGRKGLLQTAKASWRRCTTGSNHISAFGVWRTGTRRAMKRVNRTGETRWHRLPLAMQQAISGKGVS